MNILITLPKDLLEIIISGEKKFEIRKCLPRHMKFGRDGFFVVEKGTDDVRCWCRVDGWMCTFVDFYSPQWWARRTCVPMEDLEKYANGKQVYLWEIGKVKIFENLKRNELFIDRNPLQFAYCPFSCGESY